MDMNSARVWSYHFCYAYHRFIWAMWWLFLAVTFASYQAFRWASHIFPHSRWPFYLVYSSASLVALLLLALGPLILLAGLFSVRFRYVALWVSRAVGAITRWLLTGWRSTFLLLVTVALATWAVYRLSDKSYRPSQLLNTSSIIKVIVLAMLIRVVLWAYKASSRLVILPFSNYASDEKLKASVGGIATRLFSELAGLAHLYSTIDDMAPNVGEGEEKIAQASVQVQDVGTVLQGMISGESKVKLGPVELPIGAMLGAFDRMVQGPRISGSLHRDASGITLIASLTGGGLQGNWCVTSEDLDEVCANDDSALRSMIRQMAYRIFTDLVRTGSSRWRAVRCHSLGLRLYRDQLQSLKGKQLSLRKSERAFIQALAEDNDFAQNHYNLGIVYRELDSGAAEAEFWEAIARNRRLAAAYYALAGLAGDNFDRVRLCEQVISLQPDHVEAWSLQGRLRTNTKDPKQWEKVIESRAIAAALSWKLLCSAAWNGTLQARPRALAARCLFNLAVAYAGAAKNAGVTATMVRQVLYLDPTDARAHFRLGKLLESSQAYDQAVSAYLAALRLQDRIDGSPLTKQYWWQLVKTLTALYQQSGRDTEKQKYREMAIEVCRVAADRSVVKDEALDLLAKLCGASKHEEVDEQEKSNQKSARKKLDDARRLAGQAAKAKAEQRLDDASRKFAKAHENYESVMGEFTEQEILREDLYSESAQCYLDDGKLEQALDQGKNAVNLEPLSADKHRFIAAIYNDLGDYERAESEWQICLDLEPDDLESLKGIAYTYWDRGVLIRCPEERSKAFKRVIEIFNQTIELSKDWQTEAWTHYWLGRFHADQRNYDKAYYHFNIVKNMNFRPLDTRFQLGVTYVESRAWDNAEDMFREALIRTKEHMMQARKQGVELSLSLRQTFDDSEDDPVATVLVNLYLYQAMMYAERGVNLTQGLRLARKSGSLIAHADPSKESQFRSWQYESLGFIKLRQGLIDNAIADLEKAIAMRSDGLVAEGGGYYHLAMAYLAKARANPADSAPWLAQARRRCIDASQNNVRGVYKEEISNLLKQLDALEIAAPPPSPPSPKTAGN